MHTVLAFRGGNFIVAFCVSIMFFFPVRLYAQPAVEFVLDASRSMSVHKEGRPKIELALEALRAVLAELPRGTRVALRAFGHRYPHKKKTLSCKDTELLFSFASTDLLFDRFEKFNQLEPKGSSALAISIREAGVDLSKQSTSDRSVVLLTDGRDTCGGNFKDEFRRLRERGIYVTANVVALWADKTSRAELKKIAASTGGKYAEVFSVGDVPEAIREALGLIGDSNSRVVSADLGSGRDSSAVWEYAFRVRPGKQARSILGGADRSDGFIVPIKTGQKFVFKFEAEENLAGYVVLRVRNQRGEILTEKFGVQGSNTIETPIVQFTYSADYLVEIVVSPEIGNIFGYQLDLIPFTD